MMAILSMPARALTWTMTCHSDERRAGISVATVRSSVQRRSRVPERLHPNWGAVWLILAVVGSSAAYALWVVWMTGG